MKTALSKELKEAIQATVKGPLAFDVSMKTRTTIKVGGPADCIFAPADADDVVAFVQMAKRLKIHYDVLGAGSNLIVRDGGVRGVLIDLAPSFDFVEQTDPTHLRAGAGSPLPTVVARAQEILVNLERTEFDREGRPRLAHSESSKGPSQRQLSLFSGSEDAVIGELRRVNPDELTPLQALALIAELKKRIG